MPNAKSVSKGHSHNVFSKISRFQQHTSPLGGGRDTSPISEVTTNPALLASMVNW